MGKWWSVWLLVVFGAAIAGCAGDPVEPPEIELIEHGLQPQTLIAGEPGLALDERMALHGVPGVSVALIEDAAVSWVKSYGVASVDDPRPVDAETILVPTPEDVVKLRRTDPSEAFDWRLRVRRELGDAMERGRITGFTRDGEYVVSVPG